MLSAKCCVMLCIVLGNYSGILSMVLSYALHIYAYLSFNVMLRLVAINDA